MISTDYYECGFQIANLPDADIVELECPKCGLQRKDRRFILTDPDPILRDPKNKSIVEVLRRSTPIQEKIGSQQNIQQKISVPQTIQQKH